MTSIECRTCNLCSKKENGDTILATTGNIYCSSFSIGRSVLCPLVQYTNFPFNGHKPKIRSKEEQRLMWELDDCKRCLRNANIIIGIVPFTQVSNYSPAR